MSHHRDSGLGIIGTGILLAFGFMIFKLLMLGVVVLLWLMWLATENLTPVPRRLIRGAIITLTVFVGLFVLLLLTA